MSDERELLRETVAALVAKHASPAAVREAMESERGYDESLWRLLCEQVGAAALVVPEEFGGAGGTLGDAAVVLEELGRNLVPSPLLGTTLAELALLAADEPDADTLGSLAEGAAIGAVVFDRDYVINGDIADVVIEADDGKLDPVDGFQCRARHPDGPDPTAGPPHSRQHDTAWHRSGPGRLGGDPAGRRTGRRRHPLPGADRRLHQGASAIRSRDRQFPGAQAPDGRPLRRGAGGARRGQRRGRHAVADRRRRWPASRPARRSARLPPRASSCTAASRSRGSTTCSCTSNAHMAVRNCWVRRAITCAGWNPKCSSTCRE